MKPTARLTASLLLVAVATTVFVAVATRTSGPSPQASERTAVPSPSPSLVPGEAALTATINPETGQIDVSAVPTPLDLDAETAEALRRDDEGLKPVYHPDGSVSVNLQGRFQSVATIRMDEHGRRVICIDDADAITDVHTAKQPSRTLEVR
jgi:hypothetical protein